MTQFTQTSVGSAPKVTRRRRFASLYRTAFPVPAAVPARLRCKISRVRNETSASASEEIVELMRSQVSTAGAAARMALLIEDLIDNYEAIYGEPSASLIDAFMAEQEADGIEDMHQLGAVHNPARLGAWYESSREHASKARAARAAALRVIDR